MARRPPLELRRHSLVPVLGFLRVARSPSVMAARFATKSNPLLPPRESPPSNVEGRLAPKTSRRSTPLTCDPCVLARTDAAPHHYGQLPNPAAPVCWQAPISRPGFVSVVPIELITANVFFPIT